MAIVAEVRACDQRVTFYAVQRFGKDLVVQMYRMLPNSRTSCALVQTSIRRDPCANNTAD